MKLVLYMNIIQYLFCFQVSIKDRVFEVMLHFMKHEDEEVQLKSLTAIGFLCVRHFEFMLGQNLRDSYTHYLTSTEAPVRMKCQVLRNLQNYLTEEEDRLVQAEEDCKMSFILALSCSASSRFGYQHIHT